MNNEQELLKKINNAYWYIGAFLFLFSLLVNISKQSFFYSFSIPFISFIFFGIVITKCGVMKKAFYTISNLFLLVFIYSLLSTTLYFLLSIYIDGDLFTFSKIDALLYYTEAIRMRSFNFSEVINYLSHFWSFDDFGAFIFMSAVFKIYPSQIFLGIIHCLIGTLTAANLFYIGRCIMPKKYAFFAALTFSISSFTILFYAQCLKETVMVFLVTLSFKYFYSYLRQKSTLSLLLSFLFAISIILFRIPIALILIISFGLTLGFMYAKKSFFIVSIITMFAVFSTSLFTYTYKRYLQDGDVGLILERKENLSQGGGVVRHLADPIAALVGPFPSIDIESNRTNINSTGLVYRLLLALPFFLSIFWVARYKYSNMFPLIIFFIINAIGVAVSVKGLELRLSLPHLPIMYLIAFWGIAIYDCKRVRFVISNYLIYIYFMSVVFICFIWNIRNILS